MIPAQDKETGKTRKGRHEAGGKGREDINELQDEPGDNKKRPCHSHRPGERSVARSKK
ncbi:MAG: hypothetical protein Q8N94_10920 [Methanoregula sp.]|nr:hypothetical protein [Methanoregula sp.]